jgi:hypothetical protein
MTQYLVKHRYNLLLLLPLSVVREVKKKLQCIQPVSNPRPLAQKYSTTFPDHHICVLYTETPTD